MIEGTRTTDPLPHAGRGRGCLLQEPGRVHAQADLASQTAPRSGTRLGGIPVPVVFAVGTFFLTVLSQRPRGKATRVG